MIVKIYFLKQAKKCTLLEDNGHRMIDEKIKDGNINNVNSLHSKFRYFMDNFHEY